MSKLFGTSGIRGLFGSEVTLELATKVGLSIGHAGSKRVVVARDTRPSGIALEYALAAGAIAAGAEVISAGVVPTPTLGHATRKFDCIGAMITASHNPPEYNGIKIFEKGTEACVRRERDVERHVLSGMDRLKWNEMGSQVSYDSAVHDHIESVLRRIDRAKIEKKRPKVLVDAGNGAASTISPFALRMAGCQVIGVNCEPSGSFARGLEPNAENLKEFSKLVRACGADMGVAHDGDGDRAVVLDEKGQMLGLDVQLALMCEHELEWKNGTIVTTVEASLAVRQAIERHGGKVAIVPVGSRRVSERIARTKGAVFGGEPCGEYVYPKAGLLADGILAGLKFANLFCEKGKLSSLRSTVKSYPIMRGKYRCKKKEATMRKVAMDMSRLKGRVNTADGIRIDFENSWVLVRPSGTEPVIRLTCEAHEQKECKELYSKVESIIKRACG
ncbi:phosphoglucosamine mutase [Candidatus Micrarchaeota archaeon]|nr:MAG: phosphoglucosamine mutase [Candidatus Micrarchaeota archaeon]